jgi:hypothetical protein
MNIENEIWYKELTPELRAQVDDLQKFMEDDFNRQVTELKNDIRKRPDAVLAFVFVHDALPLSGELDKFLNNDKDPHS